MRLVGDPSSVQVMVGRRLRQDGSHQGPESGFARLRAEVEDALRRGSDAEDVSLDAVYSELAERLGWSDEVRDRALEVELQVERSVIRPHLSFRSWLSGHLSDHGGSVVYVSDTVLPGRFLQDLLAQHDFPAGPVFSSGDWGSLKLGTMFAHVLRSQSAQAVAARHVGNTPEVDGIGAVRAGLGFQYSGTANLRRYERILVRPASSPEGGLLGSKLAGVARQLRLDHGSGTDRSAGLRETAYGVAGPLLVAAVGWVLGRAEEDGVGRLYFVARDGELPLKVAQVLQDRLGLAPHVQCRYLYGSRRAWTDRDPAAAAGYLAQEGVGAEPGCGVVDLGWYGTAADGLCRVTAGNGGHRPFMYFLGGLVQAPESLPMHLVRAYLLQGGVPDRTGLKALVHVLESFCQGSEGTTVGYRREGQGWAPVLEAAVNQPALDWGLLPFQEAVTAYAELAASVLEPSDLAGAEGLAPQLLELVRAFWTAPARGEALAWAGCPFDNPAGAVATTLARRLGPADLLAAGRRPWRARSLLATGPWRQASLALFPGNPHVLSALRRADMSRSGLRSRLALLMTHPAAARVSARAFNPRRSRNALHS